MKYRRWELEEAFVLVKALEMRLGPIGLHAAIPDARKLSRDGRLTLRIYGDKITEKDKDNIRSLLTATEMKLKNIEADKERWLYGRGKNLRVVLVTYD